MKTRFTWLGIIAICIFCLCGIFVSCNKNEVNDIVYYRGQVVYINTTNPFPDLTVKVTNGKDTHCQTQTDGGGNFSLKVRVNEIDGSYYLLAGDSTCVPKQVSLGGYGQAEVDLGVIEVEGPALPTVKTTPVTKITAEGATLGGEVMTDGRMAVTARGICYGTNPDPVIDGLHSTDGSGLGAFTTTLKDLEHNTIYYARAYATNRKGTAYGEQVKFTTELGVPIVITDSVYRITAHSAKCKGHVESDGGYAVTKKGTCWSRQPDPTVDDECTNDGSGIGEFTSTLNNLLENTTYYVRTYATNATSTVYGEQIIITTLDGLAVVKTDSVNNVSATGFTAFGTVVSDCDIPVTARGFCYSTSQYPTIEDEHTTVGKGLGSFQGNIRNLSIGTTYYIRAYATNATATVYGEQIVITTLDGLAVVKTDSVNSITANGFTAYGMVVSDSDIPVTSRGFCYSRQQYPTIEDAHTTSGKGLGEFKSNITKIEYGTTYYVRAYATNATATTYGEQIAVKTLNGLPSVTTAEVTNIGSVKATCGGNVTDDGTLTVTARGVCYGTNQYPTTEGLHTVNGKGKGEFVSNLTDLKDKTTYYVRAYATTDAGTVYGEQKKFKTENGVPVVLLSEVGEPTANSVICKGNVTGDGGVTVTERGFCYSVSQYPTNTSDHVAIGNGVGEFTGSLTGLALNTTYYVRAYAVNSLGIGYSEQKSFTTKNGLATITTGTATATATSIAIGGNVTDNGGYAVTERGVCYSSTYSEPTISDAFVVGGKGNGEFSVSITGLSASKTYYVRAYATNENGTSYGNAVTVTTKDGTATVALGSITNITALTASASVTVSDAGSATLQSCGICWATNPNPTITDSKTIASGKVLNTAYTCNLAELQPNTTYYVRAYATTDVATSYSQQKTFTTTVGLPTLSTGSAIPTATSFTFSGEVTDNGGYTITERGICYSQTHSEPTIIDTKVASGSGNGSFSASVTKLTPSTSYYVRAYATNMNGTAYGEPIVVTTKNGIASVTTGTVSNITALTATGQIIVTDNGGATLQSCGICWATHPNPTYLDSKTVASGKTLNTAYSCNMSSLTPNTTYYLRAYATTEIATAYGEQKTFSTKDGLPILSTITPTATSTYITSGGNITSDGGYSITSRGVCYSTSNSEPTLSDSYTTNGNGIGNFSSIIASVSVSTTYYVRAYATNSIGTAYGEAIVVTTRDGRPILTTTAPFIEGTTAISGGSITSDEGFPITARGICYGKLPNPDLSSTYKHTSNGSGIGNYTSSFNLPIGSGKYYIRAYASNANGTTYGAQMTIIQPYDELPTFIYNGHTYKVAPMYESNISYNAAVTYVEGLSLCGFNDWKIPDQGEMLQMCNNKAEIGGFPTGSSYSYYLFWTSTYGTDVNVHVNIWDCNVHSSSAIATGASVSIKNTTSMSRYYDYYFYMRVRPIRIDH